MIGILTVKIPDEYLNQIDTLAESRLVSRADIVREAILEYLNSLDQPGDDK